MSKKMNFKYSLDIISISIALVSLIISVLVASVTLPTLTPVLPKLEIKLLDYDDDLFFHKNYFEKRLEEGKAYSKARVTFRIVNIGQQDSRRLYLKIVGDNVSSLKNTISNIKGINLTFSTISLFYENCIGLDNKCNLEDIPNGIHNLILEVNCSACEPNNYRKYFRICIYDDENSKENCYRIWGLSDK